MAAIGDVCVCEETEIANVFHHKWRFEVSRRSIDVVLETLNKNNRSLPLVSLTADKSVLSLNATRGTADENTVIRLFLTSKNADQILLQNVEIDIYSKREESVPFKYVLLPSNYQMSPNTEDQLMICEFDCTHFDISDTYTVTLALDMTHPFDDEWTNSNKAIVKLAQDGNLITDFNDLCVLECLQEGDEDEEIECHKCVLSKISNIFAEQIQKATNSGEQCRLLVDCESSIAEMVITFAYTGQHPFITPLSPPLIETLLSFTQQYKIDSLTNQIIKELHISLSPTTVLSLLPLAQKYQLDKLLEKCKALLKEKLNEIKNCNEWPAFEQSHIELIHNL